MEKVLIIGASTNPERYAYKAAHKLVEHGHSICMIGPRKGELLGEKIYTTKESFKNIDTVTLYISAKNQPEYYDYILSLKPKRVIFNPGTENEEFEKIITNNKIYSEVACTLVLLATNSF